MKKIDLALTVFSIVLTGFLFVGCNSEAKPFEWIKGTWEMYRSAGGSRLEIWSNQPKGALAGKGLMINVKDTTMLETIEIVQRENEFYYIATVPEENNGNPIEFKLVKTEGTTFTFENPKHDFPQRIVYQFKPVSEQMDPDNPADSLLVRVESLDGNGIDYGFARKLTGVKKDVKK